MAHGIRGQVSIGAMPAAMNTFLPLALLNLQKHYPDIRVSAREGPEKDLLNSLRSRDLDLAVGKLPSERDHPYVQNEVLLNDPLFFVARLGHPLLSLKANTVAQTREFPWVFSTSDSVAHQALEYAFRTAGYDLPRVVIYTTSITCITDVVASSDCIGPLPESMFRFGSKPVGVARLQMDLRSTLAPIGITRLHGPDVLPIIVKVEKVLRQFCAGWICQ
jgi:DNA-binding transcriptional LysR family regulator